VVEKEEDQRRTEKNGRRKKERQKSFGEHVGVIDWILHGPPGVQKLAPFSPRQQRTSIPTVSVSPGNKWEKILTGRTRA
jgi:phage tail protein X